MFGIEVEELILETEAAQDSLIQIKGHPCFVIEFYILCGFLSVLIVGNQKLIVYCQFSATCYMLQYSDVELQNGTWFCLYTF
jgi:hypothetical protein